MSGFKKVKDIDLNGVGLGYRREMSLDIPAITASPLNFVEVAPENWIRMNQQTKRQLHQLREHKQITTHGLSLSLGSPDELDIKFLKEIKAFLKEFDVSLYSEHLSYCSAGGHVYDLMPIPFTYEAALYVANRIKQVQDVLEQQIAVENVSYYLQPSQELTELEFTNVVLEESGCALLLDVNNVYVNSINHKYNAQRFIDGIDSRFVCYGHIAGHYDEAEDLKVDTHGSPVKQDVWDLLEYAYERHGVFPTLLERDFNIPDINTLLLETQEINHRQIKLSKLEQSA